MCLIDEGIPVATWSPSHVDRELLKQSDYVAVGGSLRPEHMDIVMDWSREYRKPVFVNLTRHPDPVSVNWEGTRYLQLSRDDFGNFGFACDSPAAQVAELFLNRGVEAVVITNSGKEPERGFGQGGYSTAVPVVPVLCEKHATGAGDTSFMGHTAGILSGYDMRDWMNLGTLTGSYYVEHGRPAGWGEVNQLNEDWPILQRVKSMRVP